MKNSFWTKTIALAAGMLVLFPSCLKERNMDEIYRPEGSEIIFGVENEFENSETGETRTFFSGDDNYTVDSKKYERIDWVANDKMTISYQRSGKTTQTGNYAVSSKSASNEISDGSVDYYGGTKLTWNGGSGDHKFFAMYPENQTGRNKFTPVSGGATIEGTIPSTQSVTYDSGQGKYLPANMNLAFMVGYLKVSSGSPTNRVTIPFTPAVTIFEFSLKRSTSGNTYVKTATLEATNLTGSFSFTLTGPSGTDTPAKNGDNWWTHSATTLSGNGGKITVDLSSFESGKGAKMTNATALNFTVLARPIAYTNPVLTLVMSTDNGAHYFTKKVTLTHTFAACKKHLITNNSVPNPNWVYTLEHTGTTITANGYTYQQIVCSSTGGGPTDTNAPFRSYFKEQDNSQNPNETQFEAGVTVQYAPDNNGVPGSWSNNIPSGSGLSSASVNGNGQINKSITGNWTTNPGTSISNMEDLHTARMKAKGSVGSSSSPQDLSLSSIGSSGVSFRTSSPTTANCYIVDRPGWYMFPLVYGNAISGGTTNSGAYSTSNSGNIWTTLHKHDGSAINSAYIPTAVNVNTISSSALNALCLWQDSSTAFISDVSVINKPSGATVETKYIKFYVSPDTIRQGNAVIALRNGSTILWSWHIWLTNGYQANGFSTVNIKARSGVKASNDFLTLALGECETGTVSGVSVSSERACWVKVIQNTSGKTLLFRVVQSGGSSSGTPTITNYKSSCTYYQWGRKDPFLPSVPGSNTDKSCTLASGYSFRVSNSNDATASLAIQNPLTHYYVNYGGTLDWLSDTPVNLWNMNQTSSNQDKTVIKTVYDPCPPGYCLPNKNAYTFFTTTGSWGDPAIIGNISGSFSNGWTFYINDSNGTFFEPAFGYRGRLTGALTNVGSSVGFLTSCGLTDHTGIGFTGTYGDHIYPAEGENRSYAYPVRPAVQ